MENLIQTIKEQLSPDLLKPRYRQENIDGNPMFGHCYVATEALYYLIKDDEYDMYSEYKDYRPRCGKEPDGNTHWWLQNDAGDIIDPTKEQFDVQGKIPPYDNSRFASFMYTGEKNKPSKRTVTLINKV